MGLTKNAVGISVVNEKTVVTKKNKDDFIVALAGNPNVGKSTLFNALTNMHQHTGNWPGKTVSNAFGRCSFGGKNYIFADIPGTYSLMAHSPEEEVARNFMCFGGADAVAVVCDATCLERNLNLVLQTVEMCKNVIVLVNLMDEAKRKGISVDIKVLSGLLGVPAVGIVARKKNAAAKVLKTLEEAREESSFCVRYPDAVEQARDIVKKAVEPKVKNRLNADWLSLRLIDADTALLKEVENYLGEDITQDECVAEALLKARQLLESCGMDASRLKECLAGSIIAEAERIAALTVTKTDTDYGNIDRKIDRVLTGRLIGYPVMLLMLALVFYITIVGANYPSKLLSVLFLRLQDMLSALFYSIGSPVWLHDLIVLGIYRTLSWVVSVMLPPMAIFFPLFTLLEDAGYLPRVAYNLDKPFKCCNACGKQALTMCMGFGCNAAGVVGCRIIDSERERLLAVLTNCFVPCNGRFPAMISLITLFFLGSSAKRFSGLLSALILTLIIIVGILTTFAVTKLLSLTVLKGKPSSFTLEMPPYRKPQIGKVIVRSLLDRTLFVLGRAAAVAAPAGLVIWLMANITVNGANLISHCAGFLDPFAKLMGLDGVILLSFILGFPANEIVLPIAAMAYAGQGSMTDIGIFEMGKLFSQNGWTWLTALNTILFSLFHWPCSTTLMTVKKETGSLKWTFAAFAVPTVMGIAVCIINTFIVRLIC